MNVAHLRSQFGIVPQEINLFNISIADNIGYGYQSTEEDEADPDVFKEKLKRLVEDAAEAAGIKEFIESLPAVRKAGHFTVSNEMSFYYLCTNCCFIEI